MPAIDHEDWIRRMTAAFDSRADYPAPSAADTLLTEQDAYRIQRGLVRHITATAGDDVAGYKAALTAPAAQAAMGAHAPITGVLFASGRQVPGATVTPPVHRQLLIETELGFTASHSIDSPVTANSVRALVAGCVPTIELAHMGFGDLRPTGTDLICANSASGGFLSGAGFDSERLDLNGIEVTLSQDGEALHTATAGTVMNDQWTALAWLVNAVVGQGHVVQPNDLLMTGSIGQLQPGLPGRYVADYGSAGAVTFDIAAAA